MRNLSFHIFLSITKAFITYPRSTSRKKTFKPDILNSNNTVGIVRNTHCSAYSNMSTVHIFQGQGFPSIMPKPKIESEDYESENICLLIFLLTRIRPFKNILDPGLEPWKVRSRVRFQMFETVYNKACILISFLAFFTKHRFVHFLRMTGTYVITDKFSFLTNKSKSYLFFFETL